MSEIEHVVVLDETAKEMVEEIRKQNGLLATIAANNGGMQISSIADVVKIVRQGNAEKVFSIGDQIIIPWTDKTTEKKYDVPLDVCAFQTVTLKDGEEVPGMVLQWHYATPFGVQFNNYQAFYYAEKELPAGTYNIEIGTTWGDKGYCVTGKKYQFTLTKPVPAGGQLAGFREASNQAPTNWKVYSYSKKTDAEALETVSVTEGEGGTKLGTLKTGGSEKINCLQRVTYGYNRWGQSAMRQWLNSDKGAGQWWTPQNNYDRCPNDLASKAGFLTGFETDFLKELKETKVVTALNTITDATNGNGVNPLETTYDKMFLPALEQMHINPQLAGEGETWDYWRRASGMTSKMQQWKTYPQIRTFAIENHESAQSVRLRSASRGFSNNTWYTNTGGGTCDNGGAISANCCTPACVIC